MDTNISTSQLMPAAARRHGDARLVRHLLMAAAISIAWVVLLCATFDPKWDTNDDVGMSMIAHGYGSVDYGSDLLLFSNVVWGLIVRSLPSIDDILGYSIATLLALTLAGSAVVYFLLRVSVRPIVAGLILTVAFTRPILFPQFTETAGLLAIAGVLGLLAYDRHRSAFDLVLACCLAFLAYLVRDQELALVVAVALPLVPWRKLAASRAARIAAAGLAICMLAATVANVRAYSSPEWQTFRQQNLARAPLTDFGAAKFILERPDLMQRHGLSPNDIVLVSRWFFVDPHLSNPELLWALMREIPPRTALEKNLTSSVSDLSLLLGPQLLTLTLLGAALLMILLQPRLFVAWFICLAAFLAFTAAGRSPPVRVCLPLLALLTIAAVTMDIRVPRWRRLILFVTLLAGALVNTWNLVGEAMASDRAVAQARQNRFVSPESIFVWGASLPYELVFPLFTRERDVHSTRIYGLGVLTLAPYSVPTADEARGQGFLIRLRSQAGIPLIANAYEESLLNTYCVEHYGAPLKTSVATRTPLWTIKNASCASSAQ
ncbi:hypothetical protein [Bradyrhizobium cytisi]|uniref:Glycosyltransferase RgtA/B/C/D-like domain-containing protein n=1 Tax=Bradyrhizobium cytisi TaxID=515489 RepID=A0A5S4WV66_9BRAD|nr:hypothetical protein [Bradyrhizobium cytisi]TYL84559.1 hypothetical protein FXB38_12790 [Bradyrhizobium cytisi]